MTTTAATNLAALARLHAHWSGYLSAAMAAADAEAAS